LPTAKLPPEFIYYHRDFTGQGKTKSGFYGTASKAENREASIAQKAIDKLLSSIKKSDFLLFT
jgi:hypothetical protein